MQGFELLHCKMKSRCYGGISEKLYEFKGTWPGLPLVHTIDDGLRACTSSRAIKTLTKKSGKTLS